MSEWISWAGGERPVCADTIVEIQRIDGVKEKGRADSFCWTCSEDESDIRQYRLCGGVPIHDPVNKPRGNSPLQRQEGGDHYKKQAIQPVEYIMANGTPYMEGNVIKYVSRWRDKGGLQDLKKAIHYLEMLIEHEEKQK